MRDSHAAMPVEDIGAVTPSLGNAPEGAGANPLSRVISDLDGLPKAQYVDFGTHALPESAKDTFAVYKRSDRHFILLVAEEAVNGHLHFDFEHRLKRIGVIARIEVQVATREMIAVAHSKNLAVKEEDDTDTQTAAWNLVKDAIQKGVSDIHIETRNEHADILYRIDGERANPETISSDLATAICNVLYTIQADNNSKKSQWDSRTLCNTIIPYVTDDGLDCQLRFSSVPIYPSGNFKAVLRILIMDKSTVRPLESFGYSEPQIEEVEEIIGGSQGMVLLVGPTNSGKSTAIQSFIQRIYDRYGPWISVQTIEEPVEYFMERACQTSVPDNREDLTFHDLVRATLRQDPDVVMVGEIPDARTAEHVKNLVIAGRKLLTSLHVFEVFAVFARLRELGVPESILYMHGFISGVVFQRLVPVLCEHCRVPLNVESAKSLRAATYKRVKTVTRPSDSVFIKGPGCGHCDGRGTKGRLPCVEMLIPDVVLLTLLRAGKEQEARAYWASSHEHLNIDGMGITAIAHAVQRMRQGLFDPAQVERFLGPIVVSSANATSETAE